jgi:hypothetical protein
MIAMDLLNELSNLVALRAGTPIENLELKLNIIGLYCLICNKDQTCEMLAANIVISVVPRLLRDGQRIRELLHKSPTTELIDQAQSLVSEISEICAVLSRTKNTVFGEEEALLSHEIKKLSEELYE